MYQNLFASDSAELARALNIKQCTFRSIYQHILNLKMITVIDEILKMRGRTSYGASSYCKIDSIGVFVDLKSMME